MKKISIMFVCHGNICRSPMAEYIFRKMIKEGGVEEYFTLASAATSYETIRNGVGSPVYRPAKAELLKHGITCEGKRSAKLMYSDYDKYDLFIGMDEYNINNMTLAFLGDGEGKVKKLLDYDGGGDVADPWYTGDFQTAYADIERGCKALYLALTRQ